MIRKGIHILPRGNIYSSELTVVKLKKTSVGAPEEIVIGSRYFSYDSSYLTIKLHCTYVLGSF